MCLISVALMLLSAAQGVVAMSKTLQISLGWLLLPVVAWLGLQVYDLALRPVLAWQMQHGLRADVWVLVMLAALGHAALFAWPLVILYGRAAGSVAFVMIWPVLWQHVGVVFSAGASVDLRLFWAIALLMYGGCLWAAVRLVARTQSPARFRRGPASVETLIRRHQRAVMQRLSAASTPSIKS
jgi:hypothetical protein